MGIRLEKLAEFLMELDKYEIDSFANGHRPEAVQAALRLVPSLRAKARAKKDEELFAAHINRLNERMREATVIRGLEGQKEAVLARAEALEDDPATFYRFLPVFPFAQLTVVSKMAMVRWKGKQGIIPVNFNPRIFMFMNYEEGASYEPRYIFDVRFVRLGSVDTENFEPLNIEELIEFCVHTELTALPPGVEELYALKPGNSEPGKEDLVASISSKGPRAKLDLVARRSAISEDTLVLVRRKTEKEKGH